MIKYSLICSEGHEFEAWFKSSATFETQTARSQIVCPHCGSHAVDKAIMAPSVAKRVESVHTVAQPQSAGTAPGHIQALRRMRDEIHAKAEYVGGRFAEEARRIHFDESEPRGIYGEASTDEVKELAEDGVPVFPMPRLPEDLN